MLIRRRKDIPTNNILILLVQTFKRFSKTYLIPLYDNNCIFFIGNVFNAPFEKIIA